ncbi:hypothetical protein H2202_009774 [Exophiala xenobiotica]|nr:hypothetical protein H2202_009774 [Exophiala xenobiotica]KAK5217812.1 hypothetical protein LTR72_009475 [Exophiala xenobiotica]KAK5291910.1 hypothetical protein LTR14_005459 [Exophiala xenobiotica]KAK5314240.1 hypothetical protein LTR93_010519 [Exophiala xenobiotica]KAK5494677.1 hypothetical protein LTR55_003064 [Exophiala xenobiotica]
MTLEATALVAPKVGGPLEFRKIQLDVPRPDEAVVEIHAVGICHADVSCLHGKLQAKFPSVFGHEGAGIVKQVGSDMKGIRPNDTVLISYNSCGKCRLCEQGSPAYCVNMMQLNFGGTRLDGSCTLYSDDGSSLHGNFFGQSSFSNLALVNAQCLVKVPDSVSLDLYAPLGCGIQTGVGAIVNALNVQPGSTVAIFGTGSVGMAAIMAARIRQAKTIIGIDLEPGRLEIAKKVGATHVLRASGEDAVKQIREVCDGEGVLYAMDATGVPTVIETMIESLAIRGRALTIGAPAPGSKVRVDVLAQLTMGRSYIGSNQGDAVPQEMIPFLIEQHSTGNLPIEHLVTTYDVKDYEAALEDMRSGKTIKPVLVWRKR